MWSLAKMPRLTIHRMQHSHFRYHVNLFKDLGPIMHECVRDVMRVTLDQPNAIHGIVMAIHAFGDNLDCNSHLYLLMAE
jgi:hypothetical protein